MLKKRRGLIWLIAAAAVVLIAAGVVGAYAWYMSEAEAKIIYVIPTDNSIIIQFDSSVTKNVKGTLYPAIVDEDAVADNAWNDPSRIVRKAGIVTFEAKFTMFGGTDGGESEVGAKQYIDLSVALAAYIKNAENTRDLLETQELKAVVRFSVGGTEVRFADNRLYVPSDGGWTEVAEAGSEGKVAFYLDGKCHITTSADFALNPRGVPVVRDGKLVVLSDVAVEVNTEAFLTTPDVITAKDLKGGNTKVQIALSVDRSEESA